MAKKLSEEHQQLLDQLQSARCIEWHSIDPSQNRFRFYIIECLPADLFGMLELTIRNGRIGHVSANKPRCLVIVESVQEQVTAMRKECARRLKHGYMPVIVHQ